MKTFTYMTTPLQRVRGFSIEAAQLANDIEGKALDLSAVIHARFSSERIGPFQREHLELNTPSQKVLIPITVHAAEGTKNENYQVWQKLVLSVLDSLSAHNPDIKIIIAETRGFRWVVLGFCLMALLTSIGLVTLAIVTKDPSSKLWGTSIFLAGCVVVCNLVSRIRRSKIQETILDPEQLKMVLSL